MSFLGHKGRAGTRHVWFVEARKGKKPSQNRSQHYGLLEEGSTKEELVNQDAERSWIVQRKRMEMVECGAVDAW